MLLSNAPKNSLLCSNYAQSSPIMPYICKYNFKLNVQLEYFIMCYYGVYLSCDCFIRVYQSLLS